MNSEKNVEINDPFIKEGKYYIKLANNNQKKQYLSLSFSGEIGKNTERTEKSAYLYVGPEKSTL